MNDNYLTVTALTKYIKRKMDTDPHLRNLWLRGEISNFKHHSRGHMYMTIKDDQARVQAVMFAGNNRNMKFRPENGMNVLIKGEISLYEAYGQYQLYIQQMEPDGIGALYLAYEQLKEKLNKEGLFDQAYKKKVPRFPEHIGVITSPTGAAIRDIITTIKRRYPIANVTVIPVLVQGPSAAVSIKNAIETANANGGFDTLIVGRGGGSIEELWSFNEEIVARAIFHSEIPIISAVGHETDTTISDFAADLRAPTPTGAAELAVPSQMELSDRINVLKKTLTRHMKNELSNNQQYFARLLQSYAFRYPEQLLKQKEQELDSYLEQLHRGMIKNNKDSEAAFSHIYKRLVSQHPEKQLRQAGMNLDRMVKQQYNAMSQLIERKSLKLSNNMDKLTLVNPLEIMKRGFALPYSIDGSIIKSAKKVKAKDKIIINMSDGNLNCEVLSVEEGQTYGK
ncbi:exodeoxyribonuclease VII large subunit [Oceanobacillus massiliensis]|uniref:exodeoxyribonuclease VII large subunit n=1 Tax=Oceanobacillus massiliensis TaxID=1465765 RepID=UPI000289A03D|nr:exodeoxyribonuclease VII large subunit [Oceanobacillus massiliensis]